MDLHEILEKAKQIFGEKTSEQWLPQGQGVWNGD